MQLSFACSQYTTVSLVYTGPACPCTLNLHVPAQVLAELGLQPVTPAVAPPPLPRHLPVQLDGRLVGTGAHQIA